MILSRAVVCCCWPLLAGFAWAQSGDYRVSAPTRLDWEFTRNRFGQDPSIASGKYESKRQRYQLYVPDRYTKDRAWALIVFISPDAKPIGWESFQRACERDGIFFCSPYAAGNRVSAALRARIVLDVTDDVRRRFRIDPDQTYIGGFSGGGRMACSIGFDFPEVFSGVVAVCGTHPPDNIDYLRHRLVERNSVALVTGETDVNRRENENWVAPLLKDLGVRTKLWIAPDVGHQMPGPNTMDEVIEWFGEDLERRRADSHDRPLLNLKSDEAFGDKAMAERLFAAAESELEKEQRVWHAVSILNGIIIRWPQSDAARSAKDQLKSIDTDGRLSKELASLSRDDVRNASVAFARGLERFEQFPQAIDIWESLATRFPDTTIEEEARVEIQRLKTLKPTTKVPNQPATRMRPAPDRKRSKPKGE